MKTFFPLFAILIAVAAIAAAKTIALQFERVPLGNVVRILSARFRAQVTIAAQAAVPITGDFSGLTLRQALAAAAAQAGLEVVPLGAGDASGYLLQKRPALRQTEAKSAAPKILSADPAQAGPADARLALAIAAGRRAALLKQRTQLQQCASRMQAGAANSPP